MGEPVSEATGPSADSWDPQHLNSPHHHVGPTISVDSIQGELSHSHLTGRRDSTCMYETTYICHSLLITNTEAGLPFDEHNEAAAQYCQMSPNLEDTSEYRENDFETRHDTTNGSECSNIEMPGTWYNEDQISWTARTNNRGDV